MFVWTLVPKWFICFANHSLQTSQMSPRSWQWFIAEITLPFGTREVKSAAFHSICHLSFPASLQGLDSAATICFVGWIICDRMHGLNMRVMWNKPGWLLKTPASPCSVNSVQGCVLAGWWGSGWCASLCTPPGGWKCLSCLLSLEDMEWAWLMVKWVLQICCKEGQ